MKVASDLRYGEWLPLEAEADLSSAADEDGVINESDLMDSLPDKEEKTITVRLKPPVAIRKRSEELPKGVRIRRHAQIQELQDTDDESHDVCTVCKEIVPE